MNDIYEKKAKKYKYKYLKLKKIFIGGGDDQKFIVKYATQTSKINEWLNAENWQIELICSCDENNENCNSIGKCGNNTYIYIKSMQEIINITDIKYRYKCLKLLLPKHNGINNIDTKNLNSIKEIILNNKLESDYIIKNKNIDYDDYHYLYYIQSNIANEWVICKDNEVWIKNILPSLFQNQKNDTNLLNYLSDINKIEIKQYLLFKYNNTEYLSYIFEHNNDKDERIQFTIINLSNGNSKNVLYPQPIFLNLYKNKQKIINIQKCKEEIQKFYKLQIPILELNCSNYYNYIKNFFTPKVELIEDVDVKKFSKMSEDKKKIPYLIYKLIIFTNIIKIFKKEDEDREKEKRNKKQIKEEKRKQKELREEIKKKSEEQKQNEKKNREIEKNKK